MPKNNKTAILQSTIELFLKQMGLNLEDPNLKRTPQRIVKMYNKELLTNRNKKPNKKLIK